MFANSIHRARLWAMLIAALCTPVVGASNGIAPPQDTELSLAEALRRAESRHPLFQTYRARLAAADARTQQARLRPAPELNFALEDALGSGALSGLDSAQTTIGFSQLIERGGLRDRRLDARRAKRDGLVTEAEIARLDLRAEVARRFIHVLSDQAQLEIAHQATRLARRTLAEVDRRVDAARAPPAERSRAQVSLARAELEEEHAEHELLSARRHLAAATGVMAPDFGALVGDLLQLPEVAAFDVLLAQMQSTPDVLLFANQARLRASELRLAQARRSPGVRVGAGLRRVEATDDVGLVLSAARARPAPLPKTRPAWPRWDRPASRPGSRRRRTCSPSTRSSATRASSTRPSATAWCRPWKRRSSRPSTPIGAAVTRCWNCAMRRPNGRCRRPA